MGAARDIGWRDHDAGWTASVAKQSDLVGSITAIDGHPHPI
jgi:hypothetical protein